jgi:GNAT superfamily N-acetyltransferase
LIIFLYIDSVDFTDERWEVLYLYNTNIDSVSNVGDNSISSSGSNSMISSKLINDNVQGRYPIRNFAGYMTLFTFHNPFLGSKIRVCQVLVLPHMQGRGLGREMLLAVYRLAQSRENVTEVTVEDPCPAFERLRDAVDCEWALLHIHQQLETKGNDIKDKIENEPVILRYEEEIVEASLASTAEEKERNEMLKLTVTQSTFVFESLQYAILVLSLLRHQEKESKNSESEISINGNNSVPGIDNVCLITLLLSSSLEYKAFRLKVKRRLLNNSANKHLKNLGSSIMQVKLEELYNEMLVRYNYCLKPISRIQISS